MTRFSDTMLEEIRARVSVHQVVGEYVIWDKRKSQPNRGDYWACCPFHAEKTPSFHADDRKGIYHCFGCGKTGDHFRFLTEKAGLSFPEAVERLAGMAGVPMPDRDIKHRSPEEQVELSERLAAERAQMEERRAAKNAEHHRARERRILTAQEIWAECKPLRGTHGDAYLQARGLPACSAWPWDPNDAIRFHPALDYELDREAGKFPAIVARVQDSFGDLVAVWRIYLDRDKPRKAPVDNPKVGLGPASGGAVRIGGDAKKIGIGEGLETCLAAWALENYRYPVWAGLSTSGVVAFEPPIEIERCNPFPDGDLAKLNKEKSTVEEPPGMRAARTLRDRLVAAGIKSSINPMCLQGDALDLLITKRKHEKAHPESP